jgi:predicted GNAT family acetyltransferase
MTSAMQIVNDCENGCYEGLLDGQVVGIVVYKRLGDRVVIRHTVIERQFRGQGLGAELVRLVLDDLREHGDTLTNYCGFVTAFIAANPEYQSIVDAARPGIARVTAADG